MYQSVHSNVTGMKVHCCIRSIYI